MQGVKSAPGIRNVVVQPSCGLRFVIRRREGSAKARERRVRGRGRRSVLQCVFVVYKPEQFVVDKWPTHAKAGLAAIEVWAEAIDRSGHCVVTILIESAAVDILC